MKIIFITTGGTIDKDYAKESGTFNFKISKPAVQNILKDINPNFKFEIISILKKDSLYIEDKERKKIFETCNKLNEDKIIITHGTDTIIKTANFLSQIREKIIILVGSSKPAKFDDSDAKFNIGVAVGAINCCKNGIYIAMNGRVYPWNKCKKLKMTGQFVEK